MSQPAIVVFTGKTVSEILQSGGSRSWLLSPRHARKQHYLVCVRNASSNHPEAIETHGAAFLIGTIAGLHPLDEQKGVPRWQISISNYALIDVRDVWKRWRNPVRYTTLGELGLTLEGLSFTSLPAPSQDQEHPRPDRPAKPVSLPSRKLTIAEAKAGLAAMFDVDPDAVEIIIRG